MGRVLLGILLLLSSVAWAGDTSKALRNLDRALAQRNQFIQQRQHRIDSLVALQQANPRIGLLMDIAESYTGFNNDSALYYYNKGIQLAPGAQSLPFRWKYASLLPLVGFFDEAQKIFYQIPVDSIAPDDLAGYYDAGRQMHSYVAAFFRDYPSVANEQKEKALEMQRRLLPLLPEGSDEKRFNRAEYEYLTGNHSLGRVLLEEFIDSESPTHHLTAKAAHHLSTIARESDDEDDYTYYLALSAMADVMSATREVASLQELGQSSYDNGDVARAYRYLSIALQNAVECGAPLRMVESARALPIIEGAHSAQLDENRRARTWIIVVLIVALSVLLIFIWLLRRQMKKMNALQHKLRAANTTKEIYISQFLQLCSIYMDKLNQFCKIATRKLAAGQADELYRMTKSGKFVEEQSHEFYEVFDNAFLHIYPNFVAEVNALLLPEQQITLQEGELLNTDLRILAFMRLGIEESQRIAQVLNYSLNTIYAYRNRLKARAIDRENFERKVMLIESEQPQEPTI